MTPAICHELYEEDEWEIVTSLAAKIGGCKKTRVVEEESNLTERLHRVLRDDDEWDLPLFESYLEDEEF